MDREIGYVNFLALDLASFRNRVGSTFKVSSNV